MSNMGGADMRIVDRSRESGAGRLHDDVAAMPPFLAGEEVATRGIGDERQRRRGKGGQGAIDERLREVDAGRTRVVLGPVDEEPDPLTLPHADRRGVEAALNRDRDQANTVAIDIAG